MKGRKPFLSLLSGFLACAILAGCAGHAPQNSPPALNIALFTLSGGAIGVPYRQLLIASGGLQPYTWSISSGSLPPGLTVTTDGIISGTPTTVGEYDFTVQVTDSQVPRGAFQNKNMSITVNPPLTLPATSLPTVNVGASYSATVAAINGVPPYTYVIAFGNLPDGLTLDLTTGNITGTPTTAGVYGFTVQATDASLEIATNQFTITVVGRLQGNYAFTFNGFDSGQPFYLVGSIVADGNGNITSGLLDQNSAAGVFTDLPVTGSYTVPTGSNLGSMTLVSSLGTFSYNVVVSTASDSKFILADPTHPQAWGSGLLKKQTPASLSTLASTYAFGSYGVDPGGNRYSGAGMFSVSNSQGGGQTILGGAEDTNDNGTASGELSITGGTLGQPDPATGRGTATLNVTVNGNATTYNYAYYVVSNTELVAVETDPAASAPLTLASILQQQVGGITGGSFSASSLKGQSNIELTGISTAGGTPVPEAAIGVVSFDGAGNISRQDTLPGYFTDESIGGTAQQNSFNGTYGVDPTCGPITTPCGRVTVNLQGPSTQPVWYLVATNQAFVVGSDASVQQGQLIPQTVPNNGFTLSGLLGSYLGGTITPSLASIYNEIDVSFTPPPGGTLNITYDANGPGMQGGVSNLNFSGPYDCDVFGNTTSCSAMGTAFGRFEVTTASDQVVQILYVAGSGAIGATGSKTGLLGLNVGNLSNGSPDPNPRVSNFGR